MAKHDPRSRKVNLPLGIGTCLLELSAQQGSIKGKTGCCGQIETSAGAGVTGQTLLCSHRSLRSSLNSGKTRSLAISMGKSTLGQDNSKQGWSLLKVQRHLGKKDCTHKCMCVYILIKEELHLNVIG